MDVRNAITDGLVEVLRAQHPQLIVHQLHRPADPTVSIIPHAHSHPQVNISLLPDLVTWRGYYSIKSPPHDHAYYRAYYQGKASEPIQLQYADPDLVTLLLGLTYYWFSAPPQERESYPDGCAVFGTLPPVVGEYSRRCQEPPNFTVLHS